jgi:hypothetical protein
MVLVDEEAAVITDVASLGRDGTEGAVFRRTVRDLRTKRLSMILLCIGCEAEISSFCLR